MALTIFHGPHPEGGLRTVACPTWDGVTCYCPKGADGSIPAHLEHRWLASQDPAISVREAALLAAEHYKRVQQSPPPTGSLAGLAAATS